MSAAGGDRFGVWPALYCAWAAIAIGLAFAQGGLSNANLTRAGVLGFLALQIAVRARLVTAFAGFAPRARFVVYCTLLAAVVEVLHMNSKPVFDTLRVTAATPFGDALRFTAIDLAFTLPAYFVIFGVMWYFVRRWCWGAWDYAVAMAAGQALGDGGLVFFAGAPHMLAFLPYPMTNYHACNLIPFLAVRGALAPARAGAARWLAVPALVMVYFACGAAIKMAGRALGFEPG